MGDEELQDAIRNWLDHPTAVDLLKLLLIAMRLGRDLPKLIAELGLSDIAAILRSLGVPEELIAELEEAIAEYNVNIGTSRWNLKAAQKLADAINKIKEILRRVPGVTIDLLKRLGILNVSLFGVGEAGAVSLAGPLAILGGLLAAVPKEATIEWDWVGWWRDPCEDRFGDLSEDYANHHAERRNFPGAATRRTVSRLLGNATSISDQCDRFLEKCPASRRAGAVRQIKAKALEWITEYLDWLGSH